jgi:hypothetical protein
MSLSQQEIEEKLFQNTQSYPEFILNQVTFMVWIIYFTGLPRKAIPELTYSDLVTGEWELKTVTTRGKKNYTISHDLKRHWEQYRSFIKTNNLAPTSLEQKVFPDLKSPSMIEQYLKKIFWAGAFNNIRNAGIREYYYRCLDKGENDKICISITSKHYGKTIQHIRNIVIGSIRALRTEEDRIRTAIFNVQEKIDYTSKEGLPLNPVDIQERDDLTKVLKLLSGCNKGEYI